jgi:hypothetical protein
VREKATAPTCWSASGVCSPFGGAGARRFLGWASGQIANLIPIEGHDDVIGDIHGATLALRETSANLPMLQNGALTIP